MNVLNMRLNRRGADSGPPSTGQRRPSRSTMVGSRRSVALRCSAPGSSSSRNRRWSVAHSTSGSLNEPDVAGRDPDLRVHQDPGIEPDDVVALLDHRPPPGALDVVLELHAERPVVPHGVDPAVDLARREDEAAPLRRATRSCRARRRRARRRSGRRWGWSRGSPLIRDRGRAARDGWPRCYQRRSALRVRPAGNVSARSRRTVAAHDLGDRVVVEAGLEQRVGQLDHARSRRTGSGTAPSKSEPRATCSTPATSTA